MCSPEPCCRWQKVFLGSKSQAALWLTGLGLFQPLSWSQTRGRLSSQKADWECGCTRTARCTTSPSSRSRRCFRNLPRSPLHSPPRSTPPTPLLCLPSLLFFLLSSFVLFLPYSSSSSSLGCHFPPYLFLLPLSSPSYPPTPHYYYSSSSSFPLSFFSSQPSSSLPFLLLLHPPSTSSVSWGFSSSVPLFYSSSPLQWRLPLTLCSATRQSRTCARTWATCRASTSAASSTRLWAAPRPTCRSHTQGPTWSTSGLRCRHTARWQITSRLEVLAAHFLVSFMPFFAGIIWCQMLWSQSQVFFSIQWFINSFKSSDSLWSTLRSL